jgi:asparagine synthase (glutamine-hydrolysing)
MCGIVGIASRAPLDEGGLIAEMRDRMTHRGPDDAGVWSSDDRCVWLAQRRLSILDLSAAGRQPMSDPSGRYWVTFNGEIYNYREIRSELERAGHRFRSGTDTEVLLSAYVEWGESCVERFNGMFAFGLYDSVRRRIVLARDRAGEKPLFYWHQGGHFAFASELKALLADERCPRRVDPVALNAYLAYGYVPGGMCMLQGVSKLPPATLLTYDLVGETVSQRAYWTLPAPRATNATVDDLVDELEGLLADSVRLRLHADVTVGVMLSGGVDSSLVAAMAARATRKVKTFTISFPGDARHDEAKFARVVADHFGTEHVELPAEETTVGLLPQLAAQFDEPIADSSMVPTYLVSKLIQKHATVALGGDGGDELFAGYPHYNWVRRHHELRRVLPSPVRWAVGQFAARAWPVGVRGRSYLLGLAGDTSRAIAHVNLYFDAVTRRKLLAPLPARFVDDSPERYRASLCDGRTSALQQATAADFKTYLADDILVKVDRASMLASLEVRAPWLDPRIIELAFSRVPDQLRANPSELKILPRLLGRRILPRKLDLDRKQGFSIPIERWMQGPWRDYVQDVLSQADPALFSKSVIRRLIATQQRGFINGPRLFALTMFELWRREYRVHT